MFAIDANAPCPCGREMPYALCCGALHAGGVAATAEDLMRSRYSAFVVGDVDYLMATVHPKFRHEHNRNEIASWSKAADWQGLTVHRCIRGKPGDTVGLVEFTAHWVEKGRAQSMRECSVFDSIDGRWFYRDGGGDSS